MPHKPWDAEAVIAGIHGSYTTGDKQGLRNTRRLLEELEVGYNRPTIHVAGTNGKGSICAMLESILRHAGYRTGLYTSPYLQSYHERVRINGIPLTDAQLALYGGDVLEAAERLAKQDIHPTPFEHGTALAFHAFQKEVVDVAVVEVGLGGRDDPTNVLEPRISVIASIGLDHMSILGNTTAEIASVKAGIIKPETPVVCAPAEPAVEAVFEKTAAEKHAPLRMLQAENLTDACCQTHGSVASFQLEEKWEQVRIALPGEHQLTNTMVVLATVEKLRKQGFVLPAEAVYEGIAQTVWPARLEWCGDLLLDGAHNGHGIHALSVFVNRHLKETPRVLLTGVLSDKVTDDMLEGLASLADEAITVTPDSRRAMQAEQYADLLREKGMKVTVASNMEEGLHLARKRQAEQDGVIIACGSLYFAGELRILLGLPWR